MEQTVAAVRDRDQHPPLLGQRDPDHHRRHPPPPTTASASGIRILQKFGQTLPGHRHGLLAGYRHPISTGPLEGINNKIKLLQRRACDYRDLDLFTLRILSLRTTRFELVG